MNFEVFESVVKHSQEFDISPQSTQKLRGKREKSILNKIRHLNTL